MPRLLQVPSLSFFPKDAPAGSVELLALVNDAPDTTRHVAELRHRLKALAGGDWQAASFIVGGRVNDPHLLPSAWRDALAGLARYLQAHGDRLRLCHVCDNWFLAGHDAQRHCSLACREQEARRPLAAPEQRSRSAKRALARGKLDRPADREADARYEPLRATPRVTPRATGGRRGAPARGR